MKRAGTVDQAKRFVELKQQIIAATGLAADAPRVSYLATLTLQAERLQSRVIAGDDTVTGAELLRCALLSKKYLRPRRTRSAF